jgi:hypothetical protein
MVFQSTQNAPTELEELSVERDIEADGYLVGFEDAGGSFVEVGRLENVADNASAPLEIKHQNSGERVALDSSGFETRSVTSTDSVTVTDGEAANTLHYGSGQNRLNAGDESVAFGIESRAGASNVSTMGFAAGRNQKNGSVTAIGHEAARNSSGAGVTMIGSNAGRASTGQSTVAIGANAARSNSGGNSVLVGFDAGRVNSGRSSIGIGRNALESNTGASCIGIGTQALGGLGLSNPSQMGTDNIAIGSAAARDNNASGLICIGQNAGQSASTDDQLIITDRNGNRRMVMDLTTGDLEIGGSLTQNATL